MQAVTLCSTFVLGFMNACSFVFNNGCFATPQTGNLVKIGVSLTHAGYVLTPLEFALLVGFGVGCVLGAVLLGAYGLKTGSVIAYWCVFSVVLAVAAWCASALSQAATVGFMSFLSGFALTLFRKVANVDVNNGIMTGNMKNCYGSLWSGIVARDKSMVRKAAIYAIVLLLFFTGALAGGYASAWGGNAAWLVAAGVCVVPFFTLVPRALRRENRS